MRKIKLFILMAVSFIIANVVGAYSKNKKVCDENSHVLASDGQMTCVTRKNDNSEKA